MAIEVAGELVKEERARVVALLRSEADEQCNVVETMVQSQYHTDLRDQWARWSTIAAHASRAAHALEFAERLEAEGTPATASTSEVEDQG